MRRRLQALWWTLSLRAEADIKELIKEMNAEKMKPDVEFNDGYSRTDMQKDAIIQKLKENPTIHVNVMRDPAWMPLF